MSSSYRPPPVIAPDPVHPHAPHYGHQAPHYGYQAPHYGHPNAHAGHPTAQTGQPASHRGYHAPHYGHAAWQPAAQPGYYVSPHAVPSPPRPKSKVHPAIVVIAIIHVVAAVAGVAYFAIRGPVLHLHNDRNVAATVTIGDEELRLEPGEWRETNVPTDEATAVRAKFDDGEVRETVVDTKFGDCKREYHAVSLGGELCYALVDISRYYDMDGPIRALHVYRGERDLGFGVSDRCESDDKRGRYGRRIRDARYLHPGDDLPEKLFVERGESVVRLFAMPCHDGAVEALLKTLRDHISG